MSHVETPRPQPLWLLVFLQGGVSASSLIVEIVAGRMIAPYVGMSLYTWTAIIAVVLAGFSVGHWWGGRIAGLDTARALRRAGWTMIAAALATAGASLLLRGLAGPVLQSIHHPLAAITTITLLAFFLPSLFAGVPAPILTVAAMRGRDRAEHALGVMFATGAVGAIAGTLLAGFAFVPLLGSIATLLVVAGVYAVVAFACFWLGNSQLKETLRAGLGLGAMLLVGANALALSSVCDRESSYYCIRTVALSDDPADPVRLMVVDHLAHGISGARDPRVMYTDHAAMLEALPRMRMGQRAFSSFHIGGGSYSVPRAWQDRGLTDITVAEIDPEITRAARQQFWYTPGKTRILHQDARVALRASTARYDVIVGDAFTDIAVPEHLVTRDFFQLVAARLAPGGVYAMNLIDSADRLDALAAMVVTLRSVFPSVEVWTEARPPEPGERRVFVILGGDVDSPVSAITARSPEPMRFQPLAPSFLDDIITRKHPPVLTDDFAPLSYLMGFDPVLN
ncbi:fused MFS/spermidine synthase [Thalassovita sp.]|uniref:fused MFS/spermidine synthase n=1 Tax=Thalassovita sp. TaxID=1979401 RepID=UPI0029DE8822|nr:fused MFS/spermidine synthase [Thalassovita sp.]